jgi:hypothetical protein
MMTVARKIQAPGLSTFSAMRANSIFRSMEIDVPASALFEREARPRSGRAEEAQRESEANL